jgi:hypothetical protein
MGCAMIKIRYRDPNELSPGLHAAAERHGRSTTVYLLPGLSAAQRRAALRRLKISARRGYEPKLPAPQLAVALAADRIRTTVGWAGAVFRSHPAGSTVPVMVVSAGAIAFLALSAVSIQVIHTPPRGQGLTGAAGPAASFTGGTGGIGPGTSAGPIATGLGGDPPGQAGSLTELPGQPGSGTGPGGQNGQNGNGNANGSGSGSGAGASGGTSQGADPASSGGGTTLTGGAVPTPTPAANPTNGAAAASSSDPAAPAASATTSKPSPTPTASKSGLCVNVGSLGLCV